MEEKGYKFMANEKYGYSAFSYVLCSVFSFPGFVVNTHKLTIDSTSARTCTATARAEEKVDRHQTSIGFADENAKFVPCSARISYHITDIKTADVF